MTDDLTAKLASLDAKLLVLGTKELALEHRLNELRSRSREAGDAGRFDEADVAWALYERVKTELAALQVDITAVERELYAQRRALRK